MATHVEVMVLVVDCCLEVGRACGRYHISLALLMKVVAFVRSRIGISMITIVNPLSTCPLQNILIVGIKLHELVGIDDVMTLLVLAMDTTGGWLRHLVVRLTDTLSHGAYPNIRPIDALMADIASIAHAIALTIQLHLYHALLAR